MHVFVTGATGNIGSHVVRNLLAHGHQVVGLYRSEAKAEALRAAGAEAYHGSIAEPASLVQGLAAADAVIHLAFNHDFSRYLESCAEERRLLQEIGRVLAGSGRPLLVTSGTGIANTVPGEPAREGNPAGTSAVFPRAVSEEAAWEAAALGVNVGVVRLPQVHDRRSQGLLTPIIGMFRHQGSCACIGEGTNRWPAVPVAAAAELYRLALEKAEPGAIYHAVAEAGLSMKEIMETISARLGLPLLTITPEQAPAHFGPFAMFAGLDMPADSTQTRAALGWQPEGAGLLEDLRHLELPGG